MRPGRPFEASVVRGIARGVIAWAACATGCSSSAGKGDAGAVPPADAGADTTGEASTPGDAGVGIASVALPAGDGGIGFDDLRFAPALRQVLAPAGGTGNLDLVDPLSLAVTAIGGFSTSAGFMAGSHASGCTSADEASGAILAIDHETQSLRVVDSSTRAIVATAPLGGGPDYVRWVPSTGEAWVTEPFTGVEVLTVPSSGPPAHAATLAIAGGPEAIAVDASRGRVYTNSFTGQTFAIDLAQRTVAETWSNGCSVSLGLAVDEARGFVFVACQAGSIAVLDAARAGAMLGVAQLDSAVDIIDYAPALHHVYAPTKGGSLAIVGVPSSGAPTLLGTVPVPPGVQGVTTDGQGVVWVGDPTGGRVLRLADSFAATP